MCFGIFQTLLYGSIDWLYTLHGYAPVLNFSFHRSSSSRSSFGRLVLLLQVVYVRPQILLYHMIWSELRRCKILMREWVERGKTISFIFHEFHYTKSYSCIFACLLNRSYPWEYGISVTCSYLKKNSTTKKKAKHIFYCFGFTLLIRTATSPSNTPQKNGWNGLNGCSETRISNQVTGNPFQNHQWRVWLTSPNSQQQKKCT